MLELRKVVKTFGKDVKAVDEVTLALGSGVVGLVGHIGAGKTTLMHMIATLTRPSSGQILFDGIDIVKEPDAMRRRLGFLPQDFGVYPDLSALEFMEYFAALKGVRDPSRITRLLELVGLHDQARRPAASLSDGMRRRLGLAQALLNDPHILLVDEPVAGLEPEERLRLCNLLAGIGDNKLVIVSTCIASDVESIAGQLAVMRAGRLLAYETPQAIIERARGQIWSAHVAQVEADSLRATVQVLQSQRLGDRVVVRMAHPEMPCIGARRVEPSLEEALMAQRYAADELAA